MEGNVVSSEELSPIKWKLIPPTTDWWERLIYCVKNLLLRKLDRSALSFEELVTVLCDVEATLNKSPLTYLSAETHKFIHLTPSTRQKWKQLRELLYDPFANTTP